VFEGFAIIWFPLFSVTLVYSVVDVDTDEEIDKYSIPVLARGIPNIRMEIVNVLN
jgi:hypothetical protein